MASGVRFRPAAAADWPRIWPIFRQVMQAGDTYAYDPAIDFETGRTVWLAPAPDRTWLVSDQTEDVVLGSYKTGPNRAGPGAHVATASYLVAADARGRGIGRAMVLHSLEQARAGGYRGLQFNAVAASNVYAVKLYHDLGFQTVGAVPGGFRHPEQGFVDLLIMYYDLTGE
ncbi:MAG TPA: GNAT family N-acetyltransferase [Jatrophihabitans sp.]|nr:GNAT family N-acetyltransferase [Jatrophihabitans sp.]